MFNKHMPGQLACFEDAQRVKRAPVEALLVVSACTCYDSMQSLCLMSANVQDA